MKTIIVIDKLWTGGVTTSLLNYLEYAKDKNEIDLLVFGLTDENKNLIPTGVNILNSTKCLSVLGFNQNQIRKKGLFLYFFRACLSLIARYLNGVISRRILFFFCPNYGEYDVAISYTHDVKWKSLTTGCNDFVLQKVQAKYKASYVHCDFKNYGGYNPKVESIYSRFDNVVCVSEGCRKSFVSCFPNLSNRTSVCENFANIEAILNSSIEYESYDYNKFNIVTVCRIDKEKGIFRALDAITKLIKDDGYNIHWRIVGSGPDQERLKSELFNSKMLDNVELVGMQSNPYRYIKGADLFLLPSFHEAAPMVFGESQVLKVPVLSTETTSAYELVDNRKVGYVCENSTGGIYNSLKKILGHETILPQITDDQAMSVNNNAKRQFNEFYKKAASKVQNTPNR